MYEIGMDELKDGLVVGLPKYCREKKNKKCECFYKNIFEAKSGLYTCPYGFNAYVSKVDSDINIFTAFRILNKHDIKKTKSKIEKDDNNRIITTEELMLFVNKYNKNIEVHKKNEYLESFMENIIHDIRKFNGKIKDTSTKIMNDPNKKNKKSKIKAYSKNIWAMSSCISTRLNIYKYLYMEQSFKVGDKFEFDFYKIFDKIRMCFNEQAKKRNMEIKIHGVGPNLCLEAYDSIELVPYLIIDNALKYTSDNETINITLKNINDTKVIEVEALGAKIEEDELEDIFKRRYRGRNSNKFSTDGSGIGLYLLKKICDANDLTVKVESNSSYNNERKRFDEAMFKMIICAK